MSEPMKLKYTPEQFQKLLNQFQSAVDSGKYTEKIPYETWRKLKKLYHPKIEYISPFVKIYDVVPNIDGVDRDVIIYSAKTYDWGFGRFFYDYVVKEKKQMITNTMTGSAATASKASALEIKADYMSASDCADCSKLAYYDKHDDWYYSDLDTSKAVSNYGYSDSTTNAVKIAGKPLSTNTIELNVPSLNHLGYHQIDGTWDSVASRNEVNERFEKLEAELQKKVDKAEKTECVKENDTMMKGINFDFGPCGNTVRMSMYGMAIQNISGEWVSYNPDSREIINVDVFNMVDGGKYMYKMPVAIADVKEGDIVIHNRVPMFVTAINENGTFEVTDVRAGETKNIIPTRNMFGFNFMTKVVSLFGAFTDAPTADQPFGNMLPFLMMGEGNKDIDPMMMYMLMGQGNGAMNPMMWYFLMKDGKENKDMDPMAWMCLSMAMGATPGFMTGNYPKATVTSDIQK